MLDKFKWVCITHEAIVLDQSSNLNFQIFPYLNNCDSSINFS